MTFRCQGLFQILFSYAWRNNAFLINAVKEYLIMILWKIYLHSCGYTCIQFVLQIGILTITVIFFRQRFKRRKKTHIDFSKEVRIIAFVNKWLHSLISLLDFIFNFELGFGIIHVKIMLQPQAQFHIFDGNLTILFQSSSLSSTSSLSTFSPSPASSCSSESSPSPERKQRKQTKASKKRKVFSDLFHFEHAVR